MRERGYRDTTMPVSSSIVNKSSIIRRIAAEQREASTQYGNRVPLKGSNRDTKASKSLQHHSIQEATESHEKPTEREECHRVIALPLYSRRSPIEKHGPKKREKVPKATVPFLVTIPFLLSSLSLFQKRLQSLLGMEEKTEGTREWIERLSTDKIEEREEKGEGRKACERKKEEEIELLWTVPQTESCRTSPPLGVERETGAGGGMSFAVWFLSLLPLSPNVFGPRRLRHAQNKWKERERRGGRMVGQEEKGERRETGQIDPGYYQINTSHEL